MKISELIEHLEALKKEFGDAPIEARNSAGDHVDLSPVDVRWFEAAVYIDP
jgi:hypothetical protein